MRHRQAGRLAALHVGMECSTYPGQVPDVGSMAAESQQISSPPLLPLLLLCGPINTLGCCCCCCSLWHRLDVALVALGVLAKVDLLLALHEALGVCLLLLVLLRLGRLLLVLAPALPVAAVLEIKLLQLVSACKQVTRGVRSSQYGGFTRNQQPLRPACLPSQHPVALLLLLLAPCCVAGGRQKDIYSRGKE